MSAPDLADTQRSPSALSSASPDTAIVHKPDRTTTQKQHKETVPSDHQDGSSIGQGSIMQAQHHTVGGGGGGGGGHRERDRLKFLEGRKRGPTDDEPHVLTAGEREHVRKQREAYFMSRAQQGRKKDTAEPVEQKSGGLPNTNKQQASDSKAGQKSGRVSKEKHKEQTGQQKVADSERGKGRGEQSNRVDDKNPKVRHSELNATARLPRNKDLLPGKGRTGNQQGGKVLETGDKQLRVTGVRGSETQREQRERVTQVKQKASSGWVHKHDGVKMTETKNAREQCERVAHIEQKVSSGQFQKQGVKELQTSQSSAPQQPFKDGANAAGISTYMYTALGF